ncbi:YybH family protein [Chitinimonas koreensis]|uniref:YybH family protein n=1 Tax=Chitinimonas koreensis TaxID=356302 RepID=UPI000419A561|nr:nuclear transport factor 2 family protein [Chitinimonas koreensis]QNM94766.1 nuclear transport factor 2 family protein [Chitinimonas koreensis]
MPFTRLLSLICCFLLLALPARAQEDRHDDHEALRQILQRGATALNTRDFDAIAPLLHPRFTIVTVDNRKFTTLAEFKAYWNGLFEGEGRVLDRIEAKPVADALTEFLDEQTGVTHGTSSDVYHFRDGEVRTMQTRWTAVVAKDGGQWKLVKLHSSVGLFDNPLVAATREAAIRGAVLVGVALLALGLLVGYALGRRGRRVGAHA